ncbi:glycosyltransferase family 2 protein [Jejuia pallidilutea]|uniref:glycosyltransferase family 2 protein n=1 Tax=Jejuia pallidilutea TaxID=504487 RepID=UPI0014748AC9|nr:glycosyltransferase [Jejuia pallidilutea]
MKLSIIIPTYNVEKYITYCIDSLLEQNISKNDYEILIIDDGSTDNSLVIAKAFEAREINIRAYSKTNGGVGSARNKGLDLAKGKYIYFIDPDDYLASNVLKTILSSIEVNNLEVLTFLSVGTNSIHLKESASIEDKTIAVEIMNGIDYIDKNPYKNEVWWYIIEKDFIKRIGLRFIEDRWMEDAIFTLNLLVNCSRIAHLSYDVHRHVKVKGSAMTSKEPKHYIKVIYDNANAAQVYGGIINKLHNENSINKNVYKRLKARQESFVFFLMVRILKSRISFKEVKAILKTMTKAKAYPLHNFIGKDYNGFVYTTLTKVFSIKWIYYLLFIVFNTFLKIKN